MRRRARRRGRAPARWRRRSTPARRPGCSAARLTVTFGFGPTLFEHAPASGWHRSGPPRCRRCPPFAGDDLDPERSGGDLAVQACADDPQVAFHAVRNLARIGRGAVVMRWSQLGFGRTSSTSRAQETPRNLMGFKDGTNNLKLEDDGGAGEHVWVGPRAEPAGCAAAPTWSRAASGC